MRVDVLVGVVIGAVVGAVFGGTGMYLYSEHKFMVKLDEERVKLQPKEPPKDEEPVVAGSKKEETKEEPKEETPTPEEIQEYRDRSSIYADPQQNKAEKVNYSGYSAPEPKTEPNLAPVEKTDGPRLISIDDYNYTNPEYAKRIVTWYAGSHVLIEDDTDQPIDESLIGVENLVDLAHKGEIYIRNDLVGEDYVVRYEDGVYYLEEAF